MSEVPDDLATARVEDWREPWLLARAKRSGGGEALVFGEQRFDYQALADRVTGVCDALASHGVASGSIVAVRLPNGLAMVELVHASFLLDFTLQLVNTRLTKREIAFQLRDSGAAFFVHLSSDAVAEQVEPPAGVARLSLVDPESARSIRGGRPDAAISQAALVAEVDFETPRFILYTSGTSGAPKGVALHASHLFASATAQAKLLGASAADRWLLCLPLFHVGGLSILLRSVLAGSCVVLHEGFDPAGVAADLARERVTGISLVANMLARVLDELDGTQAPPGLACVLLGGGASPAPLLARAERAGMPIAATYGLTEAASQVATRPPGAPAGEGLPLLPGVRVRIVDDEGKPLPANAVGEICITGPNVVRGYWRRDSGAFREGWLHTGDVGALDDAGQLQVFDRRSDLIVSGGENVYPAEIEAVLLAHEGVAEAGVAGIEDANYGARPAAWIVPRTPPGPDDEELAGFCRERLAGYKCPVAFHRVEALPRNATGKLLRRELRAD